MMVSGSDDFTMFLWRPSLDKKPIARLTGVYSIVHICLLVISDISNVELYILDFVYICNCIICLFITKYKSPNVFLSVMYTYIYKYECDI